MRISDWSSDVCSSDLLEDSVAVAKWLVDNAADRWGLEKIVIGGDSSGAHLAALTLIEIRDAFDVRFSGAHFVYGFFDLALSPWAQQFGDARSTPRTTDLHGFVEAFIGPDRDRRSPDVSPFYADLAGACPALFLVGTEDALLEDSRSEEHTSELQSLMRISYAVFCLKKKNK